MPEADVDTTFACTLLLRHYQALDGASADMLAAARAGDWDAVCRLEGACAIVIARLREVGDEQSLPPHEQPERRRILRAILSRDAEIRRLADPWPAMLDPMGHPLAPSAATLH